MSERSGLGGALRVVRRDLGRVLGISAFLIPIGVVACTCLVGLPILSYSLRRLSHALLLAAKEEHGEGSPTAMEVSWAGVLALGGMAVLAFGVGGTTSIFLHLLDPHVTDLTRDLVGFGSAFAAALAMGALLGPLLFAPILAADGVGGALAPLGRSFELAARLGPLEVARIGALVGAVLGAPILAFFALFLEGIHGRGDPAAAMLLSAPFAIIPGPPLALALLAHRYVRAKRVAPTVEATALAPRMKGPALLVAPVLAAFVALIVVAALTPLSMREPAADDVATIRGAWLAAQPWALPVGARDVTVRSTDDGVVVEAADGGGAGAIRAGFPTDQAALHVRPIGEDRFQILISDGERWATTVVDSDGVRQDDGLLERVIGRLGALGSLFAVTGCFLIAALVSLLGAELGRSRTLEAPDLLDPATGAGGMKALGGVLRVAEGARLYYRPPAGLRRVFGVGTGGGSLRAEGEAWIEAASGDLRFRLPDRPVPVAGAGPDAALSEREVVILSRFARAQGVGLRSSSTPLPDDAQLVVGGRDDAAVALVDRAVRRASWLAVPAMAALGVAMSAVVVSL